MALSRSSRSGRFFRGSSRVVCSSSFQSRVCRGTRRDRPAQPEPPPPAGGQSCPLPPCAAPQASRTQPGPHRGRDRGVGDGRRHLSGNVLLVAQPGGVGILRPHAIHGVLRLGRCPAIHLEWGGDPLEGVALDPAASRGDMGWRNEPRALPWAPSSRPHHLLTKALSLESPEGAHSHLSQDCCLGWEALKCWGPSFLGQKC